MESMTCPRCGAEMDERNLGEATVDQCPEGHGVFLSRADLGVLIEAETDWHRNAGQHTAPMPRITADMTRPAVAPARFPRVGGDAVQLAPLAPTAPELRCPGTSRCWRRAR